MADDQMPPHSLEKDDEQLKNAAPHPTCFSPRRDNTRAGHRRLGRWLLLVWYAVLAVAAATGCADRKPGRNGTETSPTASTGDAPKPGVGGAEWLTDVTTESGLQFTCDTGATDTYHLPHISCGGVALLDYDNDGDLDVYFINGRSEETDAPGGGNRLFRQESPWNFVDVTDESGLQANGRGMGCAVGDVDNDGHLDVYVTNDGPDQLYLNNGDGTFEDVTLRAGAGISGMSCSATFFDYDNDGFLDLFVTQYVEFDPEKRCTDDSGQPDYCGPLAFPPVSDVLLHNNGDGTFTDVSEAAGITAKRAAGLGVVAADFNGDGWQDVYVANDGYDNHLWINRQDGTFVNDAMLYGVALNMHGQEEAGMGVVAADLDNDLDLDLFLTHLAQETNTVYRNRGRTLGFEDATGEFGLANSSFPFTGFGVVALDLELDGDLDLAIANGKVGRDAPSPDACAPEPWSRYAEPNLVYLNSGAGRFDLAAEVVAAFCAPIEISRGLAAGDLDNDGDLDLVVNNIECPARILRNDAPREGHWLMVEAIDPALNRYGIGAVVTVTAAKRSWIGRVDRGSSYLTSSDPRVHFGLGNTVTVDTIEVTWSDGVRERFAGTPTDRAVRVERGAGARVENGL